MQLVCQCLAVLAGHAERIPCATGPCLFIAFLISVLWCVWIACRLSMSRLSILQPGKSLPNERSSVIEDSHEGSLAVSRHTSTHMHLQWHHTVTLSL